jgi:hypothetical protein
VDINSADWPGALVRIAWRRIRRALVDCPAGQAESSHELAMDDESSQPLLRRHAPQVFTQAATSGIGQM